MNATMAFLEGKAMAEVRRQAEHKLAHATFERQRADINAAHAQRYVNARDGFDSLKHDTLDPHHDAWKDAFNKAKRTPPNFQPAFDALGKAVAKADQDYQATLAALSQQHGVGARQTYWRTE